MLRTLLVMAPILLGTHGPGHGQIKPGGATPADPRDELRYDGKSFTYWESFLRTELKAEKRIDALRMAAFGSRGYPREATAAIVELLKEFDNDEATFQDESSINLKGTPEQGAISQALWALRKIGPVMSPVLLAHLDHKTVRRFASELFAAPHWEKIPVPITESSVPHLVRWIQNKDRVTRNLAITILGKAIASEFEGKKEKVYKAKFLQSVAKEKKEKVVVDSLTKGLTNWDSPEFEAAAWLLGTLGTEAKAAVPALVCAEIRGNKAATNALAQIKPTTMERIPGLLMELKVEKSWNKVEAARKLGEMGAEARVAVADLLIEIKKPLREWRDIYPEKEIIDERLAIVAAFIKVAGPKESLPVIVELLEKSQGPAIERELVNLFLKLEKNPKRVVSILSQSLLRNSVEKKENMNIATLGEVQAQPRMPNFKEDLIVALGAQGEIAVPELLKAFDRSDESSKSTIIETLGKIGPTAKEALPFLRKLLESPNANLRPLAEQAIAAITKK